MPKSNKKRKNGKVKKYVPKPNGISKKKLDELLKRMKENEDLRISEENKPLEIRSDESPIQIEDPTKKKYNVISSESDIIEGPELSNNDANLLD